MKKIVLWAVPRSVSTAFERLFIERDDTHVFHEPFSPAYYYGENRRSQRYPDVLPRPEHGYEHICRQISAEDGAEIVFVKELAYHVPDFSDTQFWRGFTHTFLVRNPSQALASFHKMLPDFTLEEAGYHALESIFDSVASWSEQSPAVLDGDAFRGDPEAQFRRYCQLVEIDFKDTLTWQKRDVEQWKNWPAWHRDALDSTSIFPAPMPEQDQAALPPSVARMVELVDPIYRKLSRYVVKV